MGRGGIIAMLVIAIFGQVLGSWALTQLHPELTPRLSAALLSIRISMIVALLTGGFSLIASRIESPVELVFIVSFGAWVVSVL